MLCVHFLCMMSDVAGVMSKVVLITHQVFICLGSKTGKTVVFWPCRKWGTSVRWERDSTPSG
jgi:hypothetical protein